MLPKRVRISQGATDILKVLKGRTGLTPNIICRIALILSLEDGERGGAKQVDQSGSEFNAPTLYGEFALLFECMIREVHGDMTLRDLPLVIASHIEHGMDRLRKSKTVLELVEFSGLAVMQDPQ